MRQSLEVFRARLRRTARQSVRGGSQQANEITAAERAWTEWMEGRLKGDPPLINPFSPAMVRAYRRWLASAREAAAKIDPTTNRRYELCRQQNYRQRRKFRAEQDLVA